MTEFLMKKQKHKRFSTWASEQLAELLDSLEFIVNLKQIRHSVCIA